MGNLQSEANIETLSINHLDSGDSAPRPIMEWRDDLGEDLHMQAPRGRRHRRSLDDDIDPLYKVSKSLLRLALYLVIGFWRRTMYRCRTRHRCLG